ACDLIHYTFDACTIEATQGQSAYIGEPGPGRLEVRSEGNQHHNRQLAYPLNYKINQLERGIVGPLRVLYQQQNRPLARVVLELVKQRRERSATLLRWTKCRLWISVAERNRQQRGKKRRHDLNFSSCQGQQPFQLIEAGLGRVVRLKSRCPLQLFNYRAKRTVGVIGR